MRIQSLVWLMPFVLFLGGYYIAYRLIVNEIGEVPFVIGKSTHEALKILSQFRLQTRIVAEHEDSGLHEGTIISQNPAPGQKIKAQQAVFLIVSKKPPVIKVPSFVDLLEDDVQKCAHTKDIVLKKIYVPHNAPRGKCLAQIPEPGASLPTTGCMVYISSGNSPVYIMPDCSGMLVTYVQEFFKNKGIEVQIYHQQSPSDHQCGDCVVIDQRPFAGSCITLQKSLIIQLSVA